MDGKRLMENANVIMISDITEEEEEEEEECHIVVKPLIKKKEQKYYGVFKGVSPGVYTKWSDVKENTEGFKNPKFKKFKSKREAEYFVKYGEILRDELIIPLEERYLDGIHIFTDGAYSSKSKKAGYATVFTGIYKKLTTSGELSGTNQYAELYAVFQTLLIIEQLNTENKKVVIWTDSQYSINCITKWWKRWQREGWKTKGNANVKYSNLIQKAVYLYLKNKDRVILRHINFVGIYSHDDKPYDPYILMVWEGNHAADKLASSFV